MSDLVSRDMVLEYFEDAMETGMLDIDEQDAIEEIIEDIPDGVVEEEEPAFESSELTPKQIYQKFLDWADHRGFTRDNEISVGSVMDFLFEQTS